MLDSDVIERSYKIGKNWIFDKTTAKGYKVIRNSTDIIGFRETYELKKNEKNDYDVKAIHNIPIGIIRKSVEIMERK